MAKSADHYFIKFFSQSVHEIELIRQAAPGIPEIFMYRDPLEVAVANLRAPHQSWIWLQKNTGLALRDAVERPLVELITRSIGRTMQVMLEHLRDSTMLVNYNEIGSSTPRRLLEFFGIPLTDDVLRKMDATLAYDAKDVLSAKLFRRDVEEKRAAVTSMLRDLVSEFAEPQFRKLETIRLARQHSPSAGRQYVWPRT